MCTGARKNKLYKALAHPVRRQIIKLLRKSPGLTSGQLALNFDMSRIAVLGHIRVLQYAEIIVCNQEGRIRTWFYNPVPIQAIHDHWIEDYAVVSE